MKVLGIDTSTSCGSVGFIDNQELIADYLLNISVTHSERLLGAIEWVLNQARCDIKNIDGLAISLGPGSFTGLRIGISTIKGLAFATGIPVVGVSTLDVLASQIAPTPYLICPILDARKQEVYAAFYRYQQRNTLKRISPYQAIRPEDLVKNIKEETIFLGNGVKTYKNSLQSSLSSFAIFSPTCLHFCHGSMVAELGSDLLREGKTLDLATLVPIYIRPSEAEKKWQETYPDCNPPSFGYKTGPAGMLEKILEGEP
ncbi:MAG: tRNA (adenosine(37)-N6)-threonylcarbamoyltransferase complex dimerization subunit type 1 TsaB [Syntrophaceae bacterium]|nr:tRNA (adenosine(37)-N6)-threonylcarbamoyltransferase complex dimerization subunit type 1 TsaB [Syntrophaceae bacterium]